MCTAKMPANWSEFSVSTSGLLLEYVPLAWAQFSAVRRGEQCIAASVATAPAASYVRGDQSPWSPRSGGAIMNDAAPGDEIAHLLPFRRGAEFREPVTPVSATAWPARSRPVGADFAATKITVFCSGPHGAHAIEDLRSSKWSAPTTPRPRWNDPRATMTMAPHRLQPRPSARRSARHPVGSDGHLWRNEAAANRRSAPAADRRAPALSTRQRRESRWLSGYSSAHCQPGRPGIGRGT